MKAEIRITDCNAKEMQKLAQFIESLQNKPTEVSAPEYKAKPEHSTTQHVQEVGTITTATNTKTAVQDVQETKEEAPARSEMIKLCQEVVNSKGSETLVALFQQLDPSAKKFAQLKEEHWPALRKAILDAR